MCINICSDKYLYQLYVLYNYLYLCLILSEFSLFNSFTLFTTILPEVSHFLLFLAISVDLWCMFSRHMIELVVPTGIKALSCLDEWPYLPPYYKQIACSSRLFAVLGKTMVRCSYFNARLYDIYISCLTSIFLLFYKSLKRIVKSAN